MARKKIREYDGKRLVMRHLTQKQGVLVGGGGGRVAQVKQAALMRGPTAFYKDLSAKNPWLQTATLVVKPDMLFGKRGKHDLVFLKANYSDAQKFIEKRMGSELVIGGVTGSLTAFLIEEFVPHNHEYYLAIQTQRDGDRISFGACGGVEIEENWDKVKHADIPAPDLDANDVIDQEEHIAPLFEDTSDIPEEHRKPLMKFIEACYQTYVALDMSLLEMNPLAVDLDNLPVPLDIRVELDSYASFKNTRLWGKDLEFPEPWGREKCYEERQVQAQDDKSGASMKLSVLNAKGRIWTMVAGGGASVIYADTVVDLGYGHELGNYAEYSGNPKEQETYLYARTILNLVTQDPDGRPRVLLIGGGVANFTDVAATFTGIIQALKDYHGKLQEAKVKIFVRRGGPNYEMGLRMMEELGQELDIPLEVYGPEANMTQIVEQGIKWITG